MYKAIVLLQKAGYLRIPVAFSYDTICRYASQIDALLDEDEDKDKGQRGMSGFVRRY